jgi:hypothetical protein
MPDTTDEGEEDRHMRTVGERHKPGQPNCSADATRSRRCRWDGEWIATLIESDGPNHESYLVPPIVFDAEGDVIMGREVLAAIVESGVAVECPTLRGYAAGDLVALEQKLARVAEKLGVPLGSL